MFNKNHNGHELELFKPPLYNHYKCKNCGVVILYNKNFVEYNGIEYLYNLFEHDLMNCNELIIKNIIE